MTSDVSIYGGAGFVGHALTERLVESGHRVTVVDDLSIEPPNGGDGRSPTSPSRTPYAFVEGDVTVPKGTMDWDRVFGHLAEGLHTIVWLPSVQGYDKTIDVFGHQNVCPVFNLFEAIRHFEAEGRVRKIVLASSQAVYSPGKNLTEQSRKEPISVYGVSKLSQENTMIYLSRLFDIPVYSMRYSVILGAGQSYDSAESGVLRNWSRDYKKGLGPEVYGNGLHVRDFVHIDDVTDANVLAINDRGSENLALNVAGFSCSVVDLAYIFQEVAGGPDPRITGLQRGDGGTCDITSSYRLAAEKIGYEPKKNLRTQVADSFAHFSSIQISP